MTIEDFTKLISKDELSLFGPLGGVIVAAVSLLFVWARNYWELRDLRAKTLITERGVEASPDAPPATKRSTRKRSSPQQERGGKKFSLKIAVGSVVLLAVSVASAAYTFPDMLLRLEKANQPPKTIVVTREILVKPTDKPFTPQEPIVVLNQPAAPSADYETARKEPTEEEYKEAKIREAFHLKRKDLIAKFLITDDMVGRIYPVLYLTTSASIVTPSGVSVGDVHHSRETERGVRFYVTIQNVLYYFHTDGVIMRPTSISGDTATTAGQITLPFITPKNT